MFGLSAEQLTCLRELVIDPLKTKGADVFIFGSRAIGRHHPFSDVDLFYVPTSSSTLSAADISVVKEAIEESNFPFAVEIVNWSDLAESYRANIETQKLRL